MHGRLERDRRWAEPVLDGDAAEMVSVRFESDPGYDEYEDIAPAAPAR